MAEMKGIEFEIRGITSNAGRSIDSLKNSLSQLKRTASGGFGLSAAANELKRFANTIGKIDIRKLAAIGTAASGISRLGKALSSMAEKPDAFSQVYQYMQQLAQIDFTNLNEAAASIRAITQASAAMSNGGNSGSAERAISKTGLAAKSANRFTGLLDKSMTGLKAAMSRAVAPVTKFASKLSSLGPAFRRILFYRMIRSVIREIGDAFKTGVNNLYAWSQMADGRFAASMDRMATSMLYFKNSIGAMVAPLLNALAPALDYLIDKVVDFLNVINQLFAKLTGATYWTKAIKQATTYSDAASSAGGAAKEALRYLAPFDELNVLPSDKGGGSGGSSGDNAGGMFEIMEQFDEGITDFASNIRTAIENGNWEELGSILGGKINELISNVPWSELGATFGGFINGIISTEYWTLDEINFTNLGSSIAEFINNALPQIDFDIAGRLSVKGLTSVVDVIIGLLGDLSWASVGQAISNFVVGALSEAITWLQETDWQKVGRDLENAISDLVTNIDWATIVQDIIVNLPAELLKASFNLALGLMDGIVEDFVDALFGENAWNEVKIGLANLWNNIVGWIEDQLGVELGWLKIDIPVTATATDLYTEGLTEKQRQVNTLAKLTDTQDDIIASKKKLDMKAQFNDWERWPETSDSWNSLNMKAKFNDWERWKETGDNWNSLGMKAKFNDWERWKEKDDSWNSLGMTAKFNWWEKWSQTGDNWNSIGMTARFNWWQRWQQTSDNWNSLPMTAQFNNWRKWTNTSANWNSLDMWANLTTWHYGSTWKDAWNKLDMYANVTSVQLSATAKDEVKTKLKAALGLAADGGIWVGGQKQSITSYASGGLPGFGQLFIAREAGPELVGTLKGHTAVMNNDQIVASVSAGVARAISSVEFHMNGIATAPAYSTEADSIDYDRLVRAIVDGIDQADISNDTYLDGQKMYESTVRYNDRNTKATGVNRLAMA